MEENNNFQKMMEIAKQNKYKQKSKYGPWQISANDTGAFSIFYDKREVVIVENYEVKYITWGCYYKDNDSDVGCFDILKSLLNIPNVYLDIFKVETDDGLLALGYGNPVHLMSIDESFDLGYERGWYASKPRKSKNKNDYVFFWDDGNSWCTVEKVFENMDEKDFLESMSRYLKDKYKE